MKGHNNCIEMKYINEIETFTQLGNRCCLYFGVVSLRTKMAFSSTTMNYSPQFVRVPIHVPQTRTSFSSRFSTPIHNLRFTYKPLSIRSVSVPAGTLFNPFCLFVYYQQFNMLSLLINSLINIKIIRLGYCQIN
jgi:hypothetical protein